MKLTLQIQGPSFVSTFEEKEQTRVRALIENIAKANGIKQWHFYGLVFTPGRASVGLEEWLAPDKKLSEHRFVEQARIQQHKQQHHAKESPTPLRLELKVRFWPQELSDIEDVQALRPLCVQLQNELHSGCFFEKPVPLEPCLVLAALLLQAKYGDRAPATERGFLNREKAVPLNIWDGTGKSEQQCTIQVYKHLARLKGMSEESALVQYMRLAQKLDCYGAKIFPLAHAPDDEMAKASALQRSFSKAKIPCQYRVILSPHGLKVKNGADLSVSAEWREVKSVQRLNTDKGFGIASIEKFLGNNDAHVKFEEHFSSSPALNLVFQKVPFSQLVNSGSSWLGLGDKMIAGSDEVPKWGKLFHQLANGYIMLYKQKAATGDSNTRGQRQPLPGEHYNKLLDDMFDQASGATAQAAAALVPTEAGNAGAMATAPIYPDLGQPQAAGGIAELPPPPPYSEVDPNRATQSYSKEQEANRSAAAGPAFPPSAPPPM